MTSIVCLAMWLAQAAAQTGEPVDKKIEELRKQLDSLQAQMKDVEEKIRQLEKEKPRETKPAPPFSFRPPDDKTPWPRFEPKGPYIFPPEPNLPRFPPFRYWPNPENGPPWRPRTPERPFLQPPEVKPPQPEFRLPNGGFFFRLTPAGVN